MKFRGFCLDVASRVVSIHPHLISDGFLCMCRKVCLFIVIENWVDDLKSYPPVNHIFALTMVGRCLDRRKRSLVCATRGRLDVNNMKAIVKMFKRLYYQAFRNWIVPVVKRVFFYTRHCHVDGTCKYLSKSNLYAV